MRLPVIARRLAPIPLERIRIEFAWAVSPSASASTIPRASWIGMLIVTAIYLIMSAAYCWILPADVMAQSKLVAADAAEQAVPGARKWISRPVASM